MGETYAGTPVVLRADRAADRFALVEGRAPDVAFEEFAREALGEILKEARLDQRRLPEAQQLDPRLWVTERPSHSLGLRSPEHAVALTIKRSPQDLRVIVTAEAPDLSSVIAARTVGQLLVRYTDTETLTPLLTSLGNPPAVPGDVRLSSLRSSPLNRRLATRGVDQRDVVRLTDDQLQKWLAPGTVFNRGLWHR